MDQSVIKTWTYIFESIILMNRNRRSKISCNATSVPRPFLLRVVQYSRSRTEYKRWAEQQVSEKSWRHGGTQRRGGGTLVAAAAARRRRYFGGLRREWRESWRENAVHLVRIRLYHRILWGRRKEKACLALPPPPRRHRWDHWVPTVVPPLGAAEADGTTGWHAPRRRHRQLRRTTCS